MDIQTPSGSRTGVAVDTATQTDEQFLNLPFAEEKLADSNVETVPSTSSISSRYQSTESSKTSTRRNSIDSFILGTPIRQLFHSSSTSSNLDSPVSSSSSHENILNGLDQLLHRITSERFLELRRIQLGDRPVTNGNARENLESFFNRAINGPTAEERNQEEQQNRPDTVANDVQSLLQLSRVRAAAQNGFTNQLESTLSGRMRTAHATTTRSNSFNRASTSNRLPSVSEPPSSSERNASRIGGAFRNQLEATLSGRIVHSRQPNTTPSRLNRNGGSTNHTRRDDNQNVNQTPQQIPPPIPPTPPQVLRPSTMLQNTFDTSVQLLTESIATDLTRLQSLQVVSNMLNADFRNELERMVEQRVSNSGTDGIAVAQFIQSLPRRSTTNHHQPSSSTNIGATNIGATSNDIHELRQQMLEMKTMLAMSMEIQMDTQRAIRQEVSAIFTAFMQDYLIPRAESANTRSSVNLPTLLQPVQSSPIERGQCVICVDNSVDTVLYHCGHMCVCHTCGLKLKMDGQNCPMCRAAIRDVIRAYVIDE